MKINPRGYWEESLTVGHGVDPSLAKAIIQYLKVEGATSVIDFGCGNGYYTNYLNSVEIPTLGIDGNPNTSLLGEDFKVADLTEELNFGLFDWVLSLEVGEHIPKKYEKQFLSNINRHNTKGVIISWSIPSYGGDGHVNPQENEYVYRLFEKDYIPDGDGKIFLRTHCSPYPQVGWWFSSTIMIFKRKV